MSHSPVYPHSNDAASKSPGLQPSVGYKHPPIKTRFAKGKSGNAQGRPKGSPNVADILKELLNKKVSVSEDTRVRKMATCEAIIRLATVRARKGDPRALTTVLTILEMLGATKDVTSEERQKRTVKFSRAYARDEYDLLHAPAREKERQFYLATAESDDSDAAIGSLVRAGDELASNGKFGDALHAYSQHIAHCAIKLVAEPEDLLLQADYKRCVSRIGLLADRLLFAGDIATALKCAEEAIKHATGLAVTWVGLIRAHAKMFLGQSNEAKSFYFSFQSNTNVTFTSWETVILCDFARLQKDGHSHPLMIEVEKKLLEAGWTAEGRRSPKVPVAAVSADDQQFIMLNPEHIQTAALLATQGKLDEAVDVYQRNLANCQTRLAKEAEHAETRQLLELVITRLEILAEQFVQRARLATALELTKDLLAVAPDRTRLHAIRAHAMMFIGREDEAQALYTRYRGQKIGDEFWEAVVGADFNKYRQTGRSHPLMDKVERLFESKDWLPSTDEPTVQSSIIAGAVPIPQADDIPSGDCLLAEGKLDEALEVYRRRIEICQGKLVNGRTNLQAIEDRQIAIERISDVAFEFALRGEFQKAIDITEEAIAVLPNSAWPNLRHAHALMMLNRVDEARLLYQRFSIGKASPELTWQDVVRGDFSAMRNVGLTHALMAEIEGRGKTVWR